MKHGWTGPLTFRKAGLMLALAVLLSGLVWGSMKWYTHRVEAEYAAAIAPFSSDLVQSEGMEHLEKEDFDRFHEATEKYWSLQGGGRWSFSWIFFRAEAALVLSGIGLFLWFLTLLGRGILRLLGEKQ